MKRARDECRSRKEKSGKYAIRARVLPDFTIGIKLNLIHLSAVVASRCSALNRSSEAPPTTVVAELVYSIFLSSLVVAMSTKTQ